MLFVCFAVAGIGMMIYMFVPKTVPHIQSSVPLAPVIQTVTPQIEQKPIPIVNTQNYSVEERLQILSELNEDSEVVSDSSPVEDLVEDAAILDELEIASYNSSNPSLPGMR